MADRKPPRRPKGLPKTGGRKKGTPNKATVEGKEFARSIVDSEEYRTTLRLRMLSGRINPLIEQMVWAYAYGRPVERHEHDVKIGFAERLKKARERVAAVTTTAVTTRGVDRLE